MSKKIVVVMGGPSSEAEVSRRSGNAMIAVTLLFPAAF